MTPSYHFDYNFIGGGGGYEIYDHSLFVMQSKYFHSLSKEPVVSSLSVSEGLDSNGGKSVEVELYCNVCGTDKV